VRLLQMTISEFRSIADQKLALTGLVVLFGPNSAGKTSALEAAEHLITRADIRRGWPRLVFLCQMANNQSGNRGRQKWFSRLDGLNCPNQIADRIGLHHQTARAGCQNTAGHLSGVVHREHQDLRTRAGLPDSRYRFQPVHIRHAEIKKHQIRAEFAGFFDSLKPCSRFPANLPLRPGVEKGTYTPSNHFMIIGDQNRPGFHGAVFISPPEAELWL